MIAIVTVVFLSISILMATFMGFSPNFYKLTEGDFIRRVNANTILYGLQRGEVAMRAKTLPTADGKPLSLPMGYIKKKNSAELDSMSCILTLVDQDKVGVSIKYNSPPAK
ncbi:MAG: hypothetical protein WC335_04615 [Candidatus Omnitrophota bacterium]|jgi:hypothetical protein